MSRRVLVTGGNRGIGLAIARELDAAGHKVAVTYRSGEPPEGLFAVRCDVTVPEQVEAAFVEVEAARGEVEAVVANAGITRDALLARMPAADFHAVVATNLSATAMVAQRSLMPMVQARWGRLVFISSAVALTGSPGQTNYCAAKAGLIGLARSLAWEVGSRGVTVNVVAPGFVETGMTAVLPARRREQFLEQTPLRRPGRPEEIAAAVRFLTGDDAGFITGAVLPVSGGLGLGL
ncbi:3-oxoacyl-ACP reductase FabG [Actinoplanes sp. TFC3]|uniref:3-oxoacyl-ACP reductase FabG n=1 Tax=Actinoplanes sp. TFC3 TaxID=1710355 RepID=UPI00082CBD98|nr:3-oxoacyl-ACP reductase FabG [Actinoplanes sp. TFC3]